MGRDRGARLTGEDDVDRVLGEHGDEGEHGDGETGGDVELRGLRRPRKKEGGADDCGTEQQRLDRVVERSRRDPNHKRGQRRGHGQRHRHLLTARPDVPEILSR